MKLEKRIGNFSKSGKTAKILFGLEKEDLKSFHDEQSNKMLTTVSI